MTDWQLIVVASVCFGGCFICGAIWGYAYCRFVSDRKFRRWLGSYPRAPLPTTKPPTPIKAQPATKQKAKTPKGGIPLHETAHTPKR